MPCALDGVIVAVSVDVLPFARLRLALFSFTPVTGTVTVTLQVAVLLPSFVFTVMVAEPALTAFTTPAEVTVATFVLEDVQVTTLFVASDGAMVAFSVDVLPFAMLSVFALRETPVTGTVTVTLHVAVLLPSFVFAVIVAVPAPIPSTTPAEVTVATFVFDEDHVTVLSDALDGATVAFSVDDFPFARLSVSALSVTPVTGTVTFTLQVAVFPPSLVFAVIVAVPAPTAVIFPPDTVATLLLLVDHVTALFVALDGLTVGVSVCVPFTLREIAVLSSFTPVTATFDTVTVHAAVLPLPSAAFAVIFAVPAFTRFTAPADVTVAMAILELDQVTFVLLALDGDTVALSVIVLPTFRDAVLLTDTDVTFTTGSVTVTVHFAVTSLPSTAAAVIVAVPADTAVTRPSPETVVTFVLLLVHSTSLISADSGSIVAAS